MADIPSYTDQEFVDRVEGELDKMRGGSHTIITKLIGYGVHDDNCGAWEWPETVTDNGCTCGYSETVAEARKFMEGQSDE